VASVPVLWECRVYIGDSYLSIYRYPMLTVSNSRGLVCWLWPRL
jgi:hypothetical protein